MAFEQHNLHEAERPELCLSLDHGLKVHKVVPVFLYVYHSASNVCSWTLHLGSLVHAKTAITLSSTTILNT